MAKRLSSNILISGIIKRLLSSIINRKVKEIMSKNVISIDGENTIISAAFLMMKENISALVILKNNKPEGIITEKDFFFKKFSSKDLNEKTVKNIMSEHICVIGPDDSVLSAQKLMRLKKIRKLPVTQNGELVGIITQTDIVKNINSFLSNFMLNNIDTQKVSDIMSKKIFSVKKEETFLNAVKIMGNNMLGCLPVMEEEKLVGIITEKDIVSEIVVNADILDKFKVDYVMTSNPLTITPEHKIFHANKLMIEKKVRRLPVVENDKLVGIITQTDLAKAMYDFIDDVIKTG